MAHEQRLDTWDHGSHYEQYVGRWSRRVAPSEGFLEAARENLGGRVALHQGSATSIPLGDATVDVVVSGLVLNFVPDPRAALTELARVTRKGGAIAAYVWDYAGKMELIRYFWDAVAELNPCDANMDEGARFPLCRPEALEKLFADAGLGRVEVTSIDIPTTFASFDDYWQPFLGGQGPAPAYAMSLDETARARLRDCLRERIPSAANGSISLTARAWAVRGTAETNRSTEPIPKECLMEVRNNPDPELNQLVRTSAVEWAPLDEPGVSGVSVKVLRLDALAGRAPTILLKFDPGATYPAHIHPGGEEIFVLEGEIRLGKDRLGAGDYLYTAPGNIHAVQSESGCIILVSVPEEVEKLPRRDQR